jgi:RNA polymerase sigma-70 factor (ECF subfamily)
MCLVSEAIPSMARQLANDALIAAAANGDRAALNELLLAHFDRLQDFLSQRMPARLYDVLSVDDVVQETLVRAIRGIAQFQPCDSRSFEAWLETIARHTLQSLTTAHAAQKRGGNFQRRLPKQPPASSLANVMDLLRDDGVTASGAAAAKEAIDAVQVGIACLPAEQQEAVRLRYLRGQTVSETADALGRSPAAVRGLLHRAKVQLRAALGRSSRWFSRQ